MAATKAVKAPKSELPAEIAAKLKATPEQQQVVGPIVQYLVELGWRLDQLIFGKAEWRVPKSPSEQTKRQKNRSFEGFPVDIAVFDDPSYVGDPQHLVMVIECKQPNEKAGVAQLEAYFVGEPHCRLGVWANNPDRDGSRSLRLQAAKRVNAREATDIVGPPSSRRPD